MTLHVDKNQCIGCGTCISLCPKIYKMNSDGKAMVYNTKGDTEEQIDMTIAACPVTAISK